MIYTRYTSIQLHVQSKLCSPVIAKQSPTASAGFTLLELLVVIALLLVVAGAASIAYEGVQDQGRYDAAQFEMAEIRKALLQFRRDSGSNHFPGQGVYDCNSLEMEDIAKANDPAGSDTWPTGAPSADSNLADWQEWCNSPANFWMLFINPLDDITNTPSDEENAWNIDTRRGWNGPYLQRKSGYVDIGNDVSTAGTGNPAAGTLNANAWGIASPYETSPIGANDYFSWRSNISDDDYEKHGTPYLLFDLDDEDQARIVSLAADHDYEGQDAPNCEQTIDGNGYPLDHILCLLK